MTEVNKTLYIPLYGKAYVSKKGIILNDKSAERIWAKNEFKLKRRSSSRWLAYYMGMRAAIFDDWVSDKLKDDGNAVVLHIGCGLDGRVERVGADNLWYDLDFPEVIAERKKYFSENERYKMLGADLRDGEWLNDIADSRHAVVVMEGVSMYVSHTDLISFIERLDGRFESVSLMMDCYSVFAARMSKIKNPVNDVGVTQVYGVDNPEEISVGRIRFLREWNMTPEHRIRELEGLERFIFGKVYGGRTSRKLYKLYEFKK